MSNPTSNFGWQMPTSTDLVTDLPADFEVFGQAVDTSMAGLKGGTTGQILSKTSNTNMAFTWVDPTTGDITGVTAGTGLTGGGTSGDVTLSLNTAYAIPPTIVDAKGDLIAATAADTVSRLAVGTNGQVLTADSTTATGIKWATAGGFTPTLQQVASGTLSGGTLSITGLSNYDFIQAIFYNINLAGNGDMAVYLNGNTTSSAYWGAGFAQGGSTTARQIRAGDSSIVQYDTIKSAANGNEFSFNFWNCKQAGYTSWSYSGCYLNSSSVRYGDIIDNGVWAVNGAISSIDFKAGATTWNGGNYKIWAA